MPPASGRLLPPNDPARPDWGFFRDLLGRTIAIPPDESQARTLLRELLIEAISTRPYHLLRMVTGTPTMQGKLAALALHYRGRGAGTTVLPSAGVEDSGLREGAANDRHFRAAQDYILSRLWVRGFQRDGSRILPRKGVYRDLKTSSHEPIMAWLPERAGVVPYLKANIDYVLRHFYELNGAEHAAISLDRLRAHESEISPDGWKREIDLTEDGELVFAARGGIAAAGGRKVALFDESLTANSTTAHKADPRTSQRIRVDADIEAAKVASPDTWPLTVFEHQESPRTPRRIKAVSTQKRRALALIERLASIDADIAVDRQTLTVLLKEWRGESAFVNAFPEITHTVMKHRYVLAGIDRAPTISVVAHDVQREFGFGLTAPPVAGRSINLSKDEQLQAQQHLSRESTLWPTATSLPQHQAAVANLQISISEVLEDVEPLESPLRRDYALLAETAGERTKSLHGLALYAEMERLRDTMLDRLETRQIGSPEYELAETLRSRRWNPATQSLGDAIISIAIENGPPRMKPMPAKRTEVIDF